MTRSPDVSQHLYDACVAAHTKVVRDELAAGADPNDPASCQDPRCGREHYALNAVLAGVHAGGKRRARAVEIARLLLDHRADLRLAANAEESRIGGGPLCRATRYDQQELVELLLERGAIVVMEEHDPDRPSAVHLGAEYATLEICGALLAYGGGSALVRFDAVHRTPLIVAIQRGSLPHVELFLSAGSDPMLADDEHHGDPPLRHAVAAGDLDIVRRLIAAGADPDQVGWFGHTARSDVADRQDPFGAAVREIFGGRART